MNKEIIKRYGNKYEVPRKKRSGQFGKGRWIKKRKTKRKKKGKMDVDVRVREKNVWSTKRISDNEFILQFQKWNLEDKNIYWQLEFFHKGLIVWFNKIIIKTSFSMLSVLQKFY